MSLAVIFICFVLGKICIFVVTTIHKLDTNLLMMNQNEVKRYLPDEDDEAMEFVRRVIREQPDREPLRIVEQLVEIALGELKGLPCDIWALVSNQRMKVMIRHMGRPIDEHMVWVMGGHTDRVDYSSDGDQWLLTIRRDIPPPFVTRR